MLFLYTLSKKRNRSLRPCGELLLSLCVKRFITIRSVPLLFNKIQKRRALIRIRILGPSTKCDRREENSQKRMTKNILFFDPTILLE